MDDIALMDTYELVLWQQLFHMLHALQGKYLTRGSMNGHIVPQRLDIINGRQIHPLYPVFRPDEKMVGLFRRY